MDFRTTIAKPLPDQFAFLKTLKLTSIAKSQHTTAQKVQSNKDRKR